MVGDVQNLKSIFHHKYGGNTDFNGYFDKFFSVEVFHFKNESIVSEFVEEIIYKFKIKDEENFNGAIQSKSGFVKLFLEVILKKCLLKLPQNPERKLGDEVSTRILLNLVGSNHGWI